jgi:GNAT superfamily N-acetyltransferase
MNNNESEILVVENNAQNIIGFVQLYLLFSSTRMQRIWLLNDLFVHLKFRGFGLSKVSIDKVKNHCVETNSCSIILETEKENTTGNQLYLSSGFQKDTLHNFYEWCLFDNNLNY